MRQSQEQRLLGTIKLLKGTLKFTHKAELTVRITESGTGHIYDRTRWATVAVIKIGDRYFLGAAVCHVRDIRANKKSKRIGRVMAIGRAVKAVEIARGLDNSIETGELPDAVAVKVYGKRFKPTMREVAWVEVPEILQREFKREAEWRAKAVELAKTATEVERSRSHSGHIRPKKKVR